MVTVRDLYPVDLVFLALPVVMKPSPVFLLFRVDDLLGWVLARLNQVGYQHYESRAEA